MKQLSKTSILKLGAVIACIVLAGGWMIWQWRFYRGGMARPTPQQATAVDASSSSPAPSSATRRQVINEIDLSWKQQWELSRIRSASRPQTPDEFAQLLNQMQPVLTPEQRRKASGILQERFYNRLQHRLERAERILPPDQMTIYEQRMQRQVTDFMSKIDNPYRDVTP